MTLLWCKKDEKKIRTYQKSYTEKNYSICCIKLNYS